jgi:hypothetical protein
MEPKKNGKTEVPQSRRNTMLESEHNNLQKESVMKKNLVRKVAPYVMKAMLLFTPIAFGAASCEKECNDPQDPQCDNYDPCYGKQDIYNTKKSNTNAAAQNVRNTFRAIQETPFASLWNNSFPQEMNRHLQNTGNENPTIKDTAIVAEERCRTYLNQYGSNQQFESDAGQQMRDNLGADTTYILTEQDFINYYNQNRNCINK